MNDNQRKIKRLFKKFAKDRGYLCFDRKYVEENEGEHDDKGLMLVLFDCGHYILTRFNDYGAISDRNFSRSCSECGNVHWFNRDPDKQENNRGSSTMDYVVAITHRTRTMKEQLLKMIADSNS